MHSSSKLFVILLFVLSVPLSAAPVRVIIELTDAPAFTRTAPRARAAQARLLEKKLAVLERDVLRLDRGRRVAANAVEDRAVRRFTRLFSGLAVTLDEETVARVRALPGVKAVHPDREMTAMLDGTVPRVGAPQVWSGYGTRGAGVTVAILDSGIDYTHPALGGGFGPGHRVIGGWDFVDNDPDPMDRSGHGTAVAAVVGANGGGLTGVAPECSLLAFRVPLTGGVESVMLAAIERASDPNLDGDPADRADVVNMSFGTRRAGAVDPITIGVENGSALGMVMVVSAGNDFTYHGLQAPADAPSAITVGATDDDDRLAEFSTKGPGPGTFSIKPELSAPGVDIHTAWVRGGAVRIDGTSFAAPHVVGAAALLRALHPGWSVADIKAALITSARPMAEEVMAAGAGRLDVAAAADVAVVASPALLGFGITSGANVFTQTRTVTLTNHSPNAITLDATVVGAPAGVVFSVTPSTIAIPAGASRQVAVAVEVTNDLAPLPTTPSLSFGGRIELTGDGQALRLPWAFVKAERLTVTYASADPFTVRASHSLFTTAASGTGSVDVAIPAGAADVMLASTGSDGVTRIITLDARQVSGPTTVAITPAMATHALQFQSVDVNGNALAGCERRLSILQPQTDEPVLATTIRPGATILVSDVSTRFALLPQEWCVRGDALYVGQHVRLSGITADVTTSIAAGDWASRPVSVAIPPGTHEPALRLGAIVPLYRFVEGGSAPREGVTFPVHGVTWNGIIHMTPERDSLLGLAAFVELLSGQSVVLDSGSIRLTGSTFLVHDRNGDTNTSPAAYSSNGGALAFGSSPLHPRTVIDGSDAVFDWRGPLNEKRFAASAPVVTAQGTARTVTAAHGNATFTAHFDTARHDDMPPSLTSLRFVDAAGVQTAGFTRHAAGSLIVSLADQDRDAGYVVRSINVTPSAWWRRPGGTWQPLALVFTRNDANRDLEQLRHEPTGAHYRAALGDATALPGPIHFRLEATDPLGNTITYEVTNAFFVTDGPH